MDVRTDGETKRPKDRGEIEIEERETNREREREKREGERQTERERKIYKKTLETSFFTLLEKTGFYSEPICYR